MVGLAALTWRGDLGVVPLDVLLRLENVFWSRSQEYFRIRIDPRSETIEEHVHVVRVVILGATGFPIAKLMFRHYKSTKIYQMDFL